MTGLPEGARPESTPLDPLTELVKGAVQIHEMFTAYVEAGFTRAEALQLVLWVMTAGIGKGNA